MAESEKKIVSLDTQVELKAASIRDEEARVKHLLDTSEALKASLEEKTEEVTQLGKAYNALKAEHETFQQRFSSKQELLQTLQTGLADSANTSGGGYLGQLADAQAQVVQAQTEEEQLKRQASLVERELADAKGRWKKVEREASDGAKAVEKGKQDVEKLKKTLSGMNWSEEKEGQAAGALRAARDEVRALSEVCGLFHIIFFPKLILDGRNVMGSDNACLI